MLELDAESLLLKIPHALAAGHVGIRPRFQLKFPPYPQTFVVPGGTEAGGG